VLGLDRPGQDLTPEVEKQIDRLGGAEAVIANWREVQKFLLHSEGKGEFADVLIDALLAPGHSYDTLVPEEQIAVREITSWANNSPAGTGNRGRLVMSIDVPCGINASTGKFSSLARLGPVLSFYLGEYTIADDGTRLQMRSRHIISMGAPRVGLLATLQRAWNAVSEETSTSGTMSSHIRAVLAAKLWVVDIGINRVWKTYGEEYGLASGTGVKFGMEWFSLLRIDDGDGDDDDENDDDDDDQ
jgi:NAD(P)H-hydrate repair Nnr-like enzyme with NAD(P)H-hydrate epimerase domain